MTLRAWSPHFVLCKETVEASNGAIESIETSQWRACFSFQADPVPLRRSRTGHQGHRAAAGRTGQRTHLEAHRKQVLGRRPKTRVQSEDDARRPQRRRNLPARPRFHQGKDPEGSLAQFQRDPTKYNETCFFGQCHARKFRERTDDTKELINAGLYTQSVFVKMRNIKAEK